MNQEANVISIILATLLICLAAWCVVLYRKLATKQSAQLTVLSTPATIERLEKMEQQWALLTTQVKPFWATAEAKLIVDLTHPHARFKEADALLKKRGDKTITDEEQAKLEVLLKARTVDESVSDAEHDDAQVMLYVMRKATEEAKSNAPVEEVQLVGIKDLNVPEPEPEAEVK